jgi:hemerythrin-like domain-containing protein
VNVLNEFLDTAERYAQFEWAHIRKEEDVLLPLAQEVLTTEDWEDILCAFRESDNPSFGIKPRDQAELLYQRILELAPAPIGYGKRA